MTALLLTSSSRAKSLMRIFSNVFSFQLPVSSEYPVPCTQHPVFIQNRLQRLPDHGDFGDYFSSSRGFSPCTCTSDFEVSSAGGTFSSPSTASASSACPVSASSRTLSSESVGTSDK